MRKMKIYLLKVGGTSLNLRGRQFIKDLGLRSKMNFCISERELEYCSIQWAHWMETELSHIRGAGNQQSSARQLLLWEGPEEE